MKTAQVKYTWMGVQPALLTALLSLVTLACHAVSAPPPTGTPAVNTSHRSTLHPGKALVISAAKESGESELAEAGEEGIVLARPAGPAGSTKAFRDTVKATGVAPQPYFDDVSPRNVTAVVGQSSVLHCRVKHVGDRTVSWMRKRDLHILTSNIFTYTGDARFSVIHPDPGDDWNLRIEYVQKRDSGIYECQVNTEPKINLAIYLSVEESNPVQIGTTAHTGPASQAAQASIWGPEDVYVKKGSTISLTCSVNVHSTPPGSVFWYHGSAVVDFDSPRGGISLETEKTATGTTSKLLVTKASLHDSGNYTCVPSNANPASVYVHVLNAGEYPAAMQHGDHGSGTAVSPCILLFATLFIVSWR